MSNMHESYYNKVVMVRFITHLIVLLAIFLLPDVLLSFGSHPTPRFVYLHSIVYILAFYVNYYLFIDKLLFNRKRVWLFFMVNLVFVLLCILLLAFMHEYFGEFLKPGPREASDVMDGDVVWRDRVLGLFHFLSRDFLMAFLSICMSIALKFSEKWVKWERLEQQIEAERKEYELNNLKNQLNPHFLFNTLNNIYALIGFSPEKAQLAVHELSQLLRYVLYDNESKTVPLEKDMLFVKNYIGLMKLRLNNDVTLNVDIDERQGMGLQIAPLMFVSLVENAFKHGVRSNAKSIINISIKVENYKVTCFVENTCFPKDKHDKSGNGIGIANLQRQLSILYNGKHSLSTVEENGMFKARLEIVCQD